MLARFLAFVAYHMYFMFCCFLQNCYKLISFIFDMKQLLSHNKISRNIVVCSYVFSAGLVSESLHIVPQWAHIPLPCVLWVKLGLGSGSEVIMTNEYWIIKEMNLWSRLLHKLSNGWHLLSYCLMRSVATEYWTMSLHLQMVLVSLNIEHRFVHEEVKKWTTIWDLLM